MEKVTNYLKLMRIKHYIKNLLIFVPLFFSKMYTDINNVWTIIMGFILFSFASSIVYIINDIGDIENDRKHEIKKNRPLASGKVSIKEAWILIIILLIISVIFAVLLYKINANIIAILLVLAYVILNILYTKWLKNIALLDVIIIVIGFLVRIFFGALLIDVMISSYLYLTIMAGAFYMGFGKRRNEITKCTDNTRAVLKYYNKDFLDKSMYVCLTLTVVFYSMWAVDPSVVANVHHNYLIWTVPLLLIILFEYSLAVEKDSYGDPVDVFTSNKAIIFCVLIYLIAILCIWI